ncbi:DME family drug/metabolite transporter [Kibdelosporangium banguiense]|uniref:DME family drug/metabolite transporter n=1 Tax=Kibdelosporangium banguiense TaxID=1365924 RepID=A0ABS4TBC5_9PSEU|nr:DMT family transporter [Kibdelosporangium banguiense]MBP2321636.1 DME family drug/metabolite transporter [Kibdelosporangium banguiense]
MLFLVAAGVLWGTGGLAGALLQDLAGLHPLAVAAYRLLIGGAIATVALAAQLQRLPRTRAVGRRLLTAGALLAVFQASYFGGVAMTSVSLATLVTIGSSPVIIAVVTAIRDRRMPSARTGLCITIALAGLGLLAGTPSARDFWHTVAGILLCLTAAAGFAAFTMVNRNAVPGLSTGGTISIGLLFGGLLLLPAALTVGMSLPMTPQVVATTLFLGAVPTATAYGLYLIALRQANPVAAALAAVLEPLTATVLSVAFFGERLATAGIIGAVLLGVALAVNYSAQSRSAQGEPVLPRPRTGAEVGS